MQMCGLDDKMREEKRNKGMPLKEKIGRDAVVTIPILLYGYTNNFTLLSVYIIRYKIKLVLYDGVLESTSSVCMD